MVIDCVWEEPTDCLFNEVIESWSEFNKFVNCNLLAAIKELNSITPHLVLKLVKLDQKTPLNAEIDATLNPELR